MNYIIYSLKGAAGGTLVSEAVVYGEKSAKAALDSFYYSKVGGTYYQRKSLVAIPMKMVSEGQMKWSELSKRYREGKNIRLRRSKRRR